MTSETLNACKSFVIHELLLVSRVAIRMTDDKHTVELRTIGGEMFVVVDGVTVAKRGKSGSSHAGIWMAIEPGWTIIELADGNRLQVADNGALIH